MLFGDVAIVESMDDGATEQMKFDKLGKIVRMRVKVEADKITCMHMHLVNDHSSMPGYLAP